MIAEKPIKLIMNKKIYVSSSRVSDFKKKSVLKLLDRTVYASIIEGRLMKSAWQV
jgi:hypothetical protein